MTSTTERISPEKWYEFSTKDTEYVPFDENAPDLDLTLPHGARLCAMGLVLSHAKDDEDENLDLGQWMDIGRKLIEIDRGMQWALGTWWAFGHHKYGDKAKVAKELKYDYGYLANLGRVARRVPLSCRSEVLSWSHHEKVAKLDPYVQADWLKRAADQNWTAKTLEQKIKDANRAGRVEDDQSFKIDDPEGYRKYQSHKTACDAIYLFGKLSENHSLNHVVEAITTDPRILADLDDRELRRLKKTASGEADKLNEFVTACEQEQERRVAKPIRKRERLDPSRPSVARTYL